MAELERIANHFGDIGAICNDASFSSSRPHCGILRERVLRAADACFGHRLMMDRIVPGGVAARSRAAGWRDGITALIETIRGSFPELVELYDNTASLQDRTVTTGYLSPTLARAFGAGGYVGRASGRAFDARKALAYAPYDRLDFEVPVRDDGDVNARVWIRIREVEQSLRLIEQILAAPAERPDPRRARQRGWSRARGSRWSRLSAATCSSGCASAPTARSSAAICATRPGSNGRCSKPRSKATSSPTSRSATNRSTAPIRATISRGPPCASSLFEEPAAAAGDRGGARGRRRRRSPSWRRISSAPRERRLGRSLAIREVDAGSCNGCELEIHALNNAFYDLERFGLHFVASPRHADVLLVTGPVTKNMREALERTYDATPDPKWVVAVGDCAAEWRHLRRELRGGGRRLAGRAGRPAHPRLPAAAGAAAEGAARVA